jgi:hypothetical protein
MAQTRPSKFQAAIAAIICISIVMIAGCTGPASQTRSGASAPQKPEIVREDVSFPIGKGVSTVEIDNRYGEINVRDHDGDEVGVHGVAQGQVSDVLRARVVSSLDGATLRLRVQRPKGAAGGRYDMAVYVPGGMDLLLHGGEDRVDARNRTGSLTITTTSGTILASSRSWLDLGTGSGTIRATPLQGSWEGPSRIHSDSGQIIVLAPLSGNVSLSAETGGRLSTDFGLSVHPRAGGGYEASARYGTGTSKLSISSVSGEVILDQAVILEEDERSAVETD